MKDLFESEDDIQVKVDNNVVLYLTTVRLKFKITKDKVGFCFSQKRSNPFDILNEELKTEQIISGFSEPVDNSTFPAIVYKRQPFANKLFEGVSLFIEIVEQPKNQITYPFYLRTRYHKDELKISLNWQIDDRSLFTRLVSQLSSRPFLTLSVTTSIEDKDFEKYSLDSSLQLPKSMIIRQLTLS